MKYLSRPLSGAPRLYATLRALLYACNYTRTRRHRGDDDNIIIVTIFITTVSCYPGNITYITYYRRLYRFEDFTRFVGHTLYRNDNEIL